MRVIFQIFLHILVLSLFCIAHNLLHSVFKVIAEGRKNEKRNKNVNIQPLGFPSQVNNNSMRVLVANGCSGSTVTLRFLTDILTAHGYKISKTKKELMKPHKNKLFQKAKERVKNSGEKPTYERVIVESLEMYYQQASSRGEILLFNSGSTRFLNTLAGMKKIGIRFGHMYRSNSLDRCVCMVRDCFDGGSYGFPVFANNGTKTDLCFQRRKSSEKIQTVFHPGMAASCVETEANNVKDSIEKIKSHAEMSNSLSVSYEELYAFEQSSDESTFQASLRAWVSLSKSLLTEREINEKKISDILRLEQNTRVPSKLHADIIYNFNDLEEELVINQSIEQFLRKEEANMVKPLEQFL